LNMKPVQNPKVKSSKSNAKGEKEKSPNKSMTYDQMICESFTQAFNKSKKMVKVGVTYQQIWKEVVTRHNDAKKDLFLRRLKKMVIAG